MDVKSPKSLHSENDTHRAFRTRLDRRLHKEPTIFFLLIINFHLFSHFFGGISKMFERKMSHDAVRAYPTI